MKVIALTGRAGSGKDTAAQLLQFILEEADPDRSQYVSVSEVLDTFKGFTFKHYNGVSNWHILKFAWPVYQIAGIVLGRDPEEIMLDPEFKTTVQCYGLTGRQLLQKLGTECFRETLGKSVWCDVMHQNLINLAKEGVTGVIISDLRFVNESEFLKAAWDATTIKLWGRDSGVPITHPSEAEIDKLTYTTDICNKHNLVTLTERLTYICKKLKLITTNYIWQ